MKRSKKFFKIVFEEELELALEVSKELEGMFEFSILDIWHKILFNVWLKIPEELFFNDPEEANKIIRNMFWFALDILERELDKGMLSKSNNDVDHENFNLLKGLNSILYKSIDLEKTCKCTVWETREVETDLFDLNNHVKGMIDHIKIIESYFGTHRRKMVTLSYVELLGSVGDVSNVNTVIRGLYVEIGRHDFEPKVSVDKWIDKVRKRATRLTGESLKSLLKLQKNKR